ncbi:MAG: type II toxin-antitoxin system RelE/ParE family toxin [Rhodospirillaceae bacterium]|nr:MAG: type II toxin-antitoxin system RelE/ParE family toxin [Rhodospirillaceae bacterium]
MAQPYFVLSPRAVADLRAIEEYVTVESGAARAAAIHERIYHSLNMLAYWPNSGRLRRELEGQPRGFAVAPWYVFYEPLATLDGIHVLRVVDGRRDIQAISIR